MGIGEKLKKIKNMVFRYSYYNVPPCPLCGSPRTGRYVKTPAIDPEYMYRKSLANGEIIKFEKREPVKNCFCLDCGHEWGKTIFPSMLPADEIHEQKLRRGTIRMYEEYAKDNFVNGRPPKSGAFSRWFL